MTKLERLELIKDRVNELKEDNMGQLKRLQLESENFTNLRDIVNFSMLYDDETSEYSCDLTLKEFGKKFKAPTVAISYANITFYCDIECLDYVIDDISGRFELSLVNAYDENEDDIIDC